MLETLAQLVTRTRKRERWSRADVVERARKAGFDISDSYIASIEKGQTKSPTAHKLIALAYGLKVSPIEVFQAAGIFEPSDVRAFMVTDPDIMERLGGADLTGSKPGNHDHDMISARLNPKTKAQPSVKLHQQPQHGLSAGGRLEEIPITGLIRLPVFGAVSCGEPSWVPDQAVGWVDVPDFLVNGAEAAVVVRGISMVGCGFEEGDVLTVRRLDGARPASGKKVVACIEGEYTCAVYRSEEIGEYLEKWYGNEPPKRYPIKGETRLHAVVVGSLRRE